MLITGQFRNAGNEIITLNITTNNSSTPVKTIGEDGLFFGGDPIQIETNCDDMFEHIIRKSCTINLVSDNYVGDLFFANNARYSKVEIMKGNECLFYGFIDPNTFSQPFSSPLDDFSINCIDVLSTLQYYKYNNITLNTYVSAKQNAATVDFYTIFENAFDPVLTGQMYYDNSKGYFNVSRKFVFENLGISELVFLGDEFDDVWTQEDVINEILKYLNLHIVQEGKDFYIFDWGTIKQKRTDWSDFFTHINKTTNPKTIMLLSEMHADNDTNITVADVYNQIVLKCDVEEQNELIESPLDKNSLTSVFDSRNIYMTEYISEGNGENAYHGFEQMIKNGYTAYEAATKIDWYVKVLENNQWKFNIGNDQTIKDIYERENGTFINQWKIPYYLKQNQIKPALLSLGSVETKANLHDNSPINKISMNNFLFISINGNEQDTAAEHSPADSTIENAQPLIEFVSNVSGGIYSPADTQTTNYLVFSGKMMLQGIQKETGTYQDIFEKIGTRNPETGMYYYYGQTIPSENAGDGQRYYTRKFYTQKYPTVEDNTYLTDNTTSLMPIAKDKSSKAYSYDYSQTWNDTDLYTKLPLLECELIIGNKRLIETNIDEFGNSTFEWVTIGQEPQIEYIDDEGQTVTYPLKTFSLGINPKIGDYIIGEEYDIQDTINYKMNIDAQGTAIPIKSTDALSGAVIFRILGPVQTTWNNITRRHPSFWRSTKYEENMVYLLAHTENLIIKDFECKIYTDTAGKEIMEDKDLIYLSDENNEYIHKKDDITFKFLTQLTTEESAEIGVNTTINLNSVANVWTNTPVTRIWDNIGGEFGKAEEHYINQYYLEYNTPKILMETTLHNTEDTNIFNLFQSNALNKTFFVQSKNLDVKNNTATITLKEI